jgi:hypothetical protein
MSITALIERHGAERGFSIPVVLDVVYTKELRTSKLFVPALHTLTRMGIDWWDNLV